MDPAGSHHGQQPIFGKFILLPIKIRFYFDLLELDKLQLFSLEILKRSFRKFSIEYFKDILQAVSHRTNVEGFR